MKPSVCRHADFACGRVTFLASPRKSNQKKATPTIVLILRCSEKSETKKTRYAQTAFCSDRIFLPLLGTNQRRPDEPIFDGFAMRSTINQLRAPRWRFSRCLRNVRQFRLRTSVSVRGFSLRAIEYLLALETRTARS